MSFAGYSVWMLGKIIDGRTDLVWEWVAAGNPATATGAEGVSLLQWCAYYVDVSAVRLLLERGAKLDTLGEDLGLHAAAFHGHWQLCEFLLENGAAANHRLADTGETPLHAALCKTNRVRHNQVMRVLLAHGADPNGATKPGEEIGCFMRDCRTRGETPLHRAAAYGDEEAIKLLLEAAAKVEVRDANGDSPLTWASWHLWHAAILCMLCFGEFRVRAEYRGMELDLVGRAVIS